jgi:hypothetical protein
MHINGFLAQKRTAAECRERADMWAHKAVLTKDETIRAMLTGLADQWIFLADQTERFEARQRSASF